MPKTLTTDTTDHLKLNQIYMILIAMSGCTENDLLRDLIFLSESYCKLSKAPVSASAVSVTCLLSSRYFSHVTHSSLVQVAVLETMKHSSIVGTRDVVFVQIKCSLVTLERAASVDGDVVC